MKLKCKLLVLLSVIAGTVHAQQNRSPSFNIGDPAPPLRVKEWVKGPPIEGLEKGKAYVVEFWATWCRPCVESMPHLSKLARKYKKRKVTFLAVSVLEDRGTRGATAEKLTAFVEAMGNTMDFSVASEDTSFTIQDWLRAFHQDYIPISFVVDTRGRVAWIGDPPKLDSVLKSITKNTWDIEGESSRKRYADSVKGYLEDLDDSLNSKVLRYQGKYTDLSDRGFPDSTLKVIDQMVKKEPKLRYAPWTTQYTFSALLNTDIHQAYEFGRQAIASSYKAYAYDSIIGDIRDDIHKLNTPTREIYLLGAECCQARIAQLPPYAWPADVAKKYREMADWYRLGGEKRKAIKAERKAIKYDKKDLKATR